MSRRKAHNRLNLVGQTFNRLTVIAEAEPYITPSTGKKSTKWLCQCSCGNQSKVKGSMLKNGHIKSCGCLKNEKASARMFKHGHNKNNKERSRTYDAWRAMRERCDNPNHTQYRDYGGRGISYDPNWSDFAHFLADMGECPPGLELDKIDNDLNYCKSNCRWATDEIQANNKRTNRHLTFQGQTRTIAEWSKETGISQSVIKQRIDRLGWNIAEALTVPVIPYQKYKKRASICDIRAAMTSHRLAA